MFVWALTITGSQMSQMEWKTFRSTLIWLPNSLNGAGLKMRSKEPSRKTFLEHGAKLLRLLRDYSKAIHGEMDDGFQMKIFGKKNLDAKNFILGFEIKNHYSNN